MKGFKKITQLKGTEKVIGFVLINVAAAHEAYVHTKLADISDIKEIHSLFGEYDIIAKIEAKTFEKLGHIIVNKIRCIDGVTDTRTLTVTKVIK